MADESEIIAAADIDPELSTQEVVTPPTVEEWSSIREAATGYGADLSQFQDDQAALKHLVETSRAADEYRRQAEQQAELAKYGREYLQNAGEFQQWRSAQQQAKPEPDPYAIPQYNPLWDSQLTFDEATGEITPVAARGGTHKTVQDFLEFRQFQQDYARNPIKYIQPVVDRTATQKAQELVRQEIASYVSRQEAQSLVNNYADILYERDPTGQVRFVNGQPMLSQDGQYVQDLIKRSEGWEALTPSQRQQQLVREVLELRRFSRQQVTPESKKENFLRAAAAPSRASAGEAPLDSGIASGPSKNSLYEQMLVDMKANGFNPHDDLVGV